jgi:hypothetical protein
MANYVVRETFTVMYFVEADSEAAAIEKAKTVGPRDFDEIDQSAPFPPMTAELDDER